MKIVLLSTNDIRGGASVASHRLIDALNIYGEDAKLLVQSKESDNKNIISTTNNIFKKWLNFLRFAYERYTVLRYEKSKDIRFTFSPANTGENIHKHPLVKQADIIHLHWFNFGFISLKGLKKLIELKKPIVWTMHDMWAFTGGCHYAGNCSRFTDFCKECPFLKEKDNTHLVSKIFREKRLFLKDANINFVSCSSWLGNTATRSKLLSKFNVHTIPNPIDTELYAPMNKAESREAFSLPQNKRLLLFGAANIHDKRKGLDFLIDALRIAIKRKPELKSEVELVTFGKNSEDIKELLPLKIHNLSFLSPGKQMALAYNTSDIYILPSLEDNLPNTIMEALSCGVPVVAFNTGGIPEMIDHKKNGYLASYRSSEDLTNGIIFTLYEADRQNLSDDARNKVLKSYSEKNIAEKYVKLYKSLLSDCPKSAENSSL